MMVVAMIGWGGCVPAPDHQTTRIEAASDLKIRMTDKGRVEVSRSAAETTPVPEGVEVESSSEN